MSFAPAFLRAGEQEAGHEFLPPDLVQIAERDLPANAVTVLQEPVFGAPVVALERHHGPAAVHEFLPDCIGFGFRFAGDVKRNGGVVRK